MIMIATYAIWNISVGMSYIGILIPLVVIGLGPLVAAYSAISSIVPHIPLGREMQLLNAEFQPLLSKFQPNSKDRSFYSQFLFFLTSVAISFQESYRCRHIVEGFLFAIVPTFIFAPSNFFIGVIFPSFDYKGGGKFQM
jgi:hypothetical protein